MTPTIPHLVITFLVLYSTLFAHPNNPKPFSSADFRTLYSEAF